MQNINILVPELLSIIDVVESHKVSIASVWVKIASVKSVFQNYKISTLKFRDNYGVPILEYFIAVVREEKLAGNCPIMSKLVNFLLEKNINPQDVFDICMGLRRTLIKFIFSRNILNHNEVEILEEISNIFDANLSGVLEIFTSFYAHKQEVLEKSISQQKKYNQVLKIINFMSTKIIIVQSGRIIMGNQSLFKTLGVNNIKELYAKYDNSFSFMKSIDALNSNSSSEVDKWISENSNAQKPFITKIFNYNYQKDVSYSGKISTISEENESLKYIISLNSISSEYEDEENINRRFEYDEMTGLYNYIKFNSLLEQLKMKALEESKKLALIVVDIPDLKKINIQKGIESGNKILLDTLNTLKHFANEGITLARLEGSRFGIAMPYISEQEVYDKSITLQLELDKRPERKLMSLTSFEKSESTNKTLMRAYHLVEVLSASDDMIINTDFENITKHEPLSEQKRFTQSLQGVSSIGLTMYYKGLLVPSEPKILKINDEEIFLKVSHKEIKIAVLESSVYLNFLLFGNVKAAIKTIDKHNAIVTLYKFRLSKHTPLNRQKIRVEMPEGIRAKIFSSGITIDAVVFDANDEYIAFKVEKKRYLDEGNIVSIETRLHQEEYLTHFSVAGTIYKVEKAENFYKVVILCDMDSTNKNILKSYISARQIALIQELKR